MKFTNPFKDILAHVMFVLFLTSRIFVFLYVVLSNTVSLMWLLCRLYDGRGSVLNLFPLELSRCIDIDNKYQ